MRRIHVTLITLLILICSTSLEAQNKKIKTEGFVFLRQVNDTVLTAYRGKIKVNKKNFVYIGEKNDVTVQNNQLLRTNNFTIPIKYIEEIQLLDKFYDGQQFFHFKLGKEFMKFSSSDSKSIVDFIKSLQK